MDIANKTPSRNKLLYIFSMQLLDALSDSDAVVVQDLSGATVCSAPGALETQDWLPQESLSSSPQISGCTAGDGSERVRHEIPLRTDPSSRPFGRLIIRFTSNHAERNRRDLENARDVIDCITRHLAIITDLSSSRISASQNRADLEFLSGLDDLMLHQGANTALDILLSETARHLDCTMAAVLAPDSKTKLFWPSDALKEEQSKGGIIRAAGKLFANARESRKVIVSSDSKLARLLRTSRGEGEQILCSPVADPRSNVSGVLILVRKNQFSRDDVRVARALCVKVSGLLAAPRAVKEGPLDRRAVIDRIDSDIERAAGAERALLFVDIDRLHIVNDRFGHAVGDEAIDAVTRVLSAIARPSDAVASLSGDLLGLYLNKANEEQAIAAAERVLGEVRTTSVARSNRSTGLSVSIGIALIPEHAATASQAVNIAEVACQSAKSRGTGQYVLFQDQDASIMQRHTDLSEIGNLQSALIEDRFVIFAQKIRSLQSAESARKFELLTRMVDSDGSLVPPQKFLSAAERYQMMPALDRWVISRALKQLSDAENMLEINLSSFAINVSGQSIADEEFSDFVVSSVQESGLSPDSICFEITESAAVKSIDQAVKFIDDVRQIGCSVALDDFGTGYCSFSYLQDIPVDFLKIDGMFITNINENPLSEAIVQAVVGIAKVKGAATIAEYVEDDAIAKRLRKHGVDFGQGFGIGRPEPLADVLDRMVSPLDIGLTSTIQIPDPGIIQKFA